MLRFSSSTVRLHSPQTLASVRSTIRAVRPSPLPTRSCLSPAFNNSEAATLRRSRQVIKVISRTFYRRVLYKKSCFQLSCILPDANGTPLKAFCAFSTCQPLRVCLLGPYAPWKASDRYQPSARATRPQWQSSSHIESVEWHLT
jgi:hypothetical protein